MCIRDSVIPRYCTVRINNTTKAATKVKHIAEITWIQEEIEQLYIKKNRLNSLLYKAHLTLLKEIHSIILPNILQYINQQVTKFTLPIVHKHDKKLNKLTTRRHHDKFTGCKHTFYTRVSNLTDIKFDAQEMNIRCV